MQSTGFFCEVHKIKGTLKKKKSVSSDELFVSKITSRQKTGGKTSGVLCYVWQFYQIYNSNQGIMSILS